MLKSCSKYCEVAILRKEKEMEKKYIDVDAVPGERWFPKETSFEEDINEY